MHDQTHPREGARTGTLHAIAAAAMEQDRVLAAPSLQAAVGGAARLGLVLAVTPPNPPPAAAAAARSSSNDTNDNRSAFPHNTGAFAYSNTIGNESIEHVGKSQSCMVSTWPSIYIYASRAYCTYWCTRARLRPIPSDNHARAHDCCTTTSVMHGLKYHPTPHLSTQPAHKYTRAVVRSAIQL